MKKKSIKLTVNIGKADLIRKREQVRRFSEKGLTTQVTLALRGRQRMFKDKAEETMEEFLQGLKSGQPKWSGPQLQVTVVPTG